MGHPGSVIRTENRLEMRFSRSPYIPTASASPAAQVVVAAAHAAGPRASAAIVRTTVAAFSPPQAAADSIQPALQVVAVAEEYRPPPLRSRRQR